METEPEGQPPSSLIRKAPTAPSIVHIYVVLEELTHALIEMADTGERTARLEDVLDALKPITKRVR